MRKLLLTSAGTNVKEEIIKILPKSPYKLKVAYIITASKPELDKNYALVDRNELLKIGFQIEDLDIEEKNEKELRKILIDKDIIYVQGGNPFYLLRAVKESGFDKVVKEMISKGKIYIGVSAGSSIACPTIEQAYWKNLDKNIVGLRDLTALNFVPFLLVAHFEEKYRESVELGANKTQLPVVALSDVQAVLIEDGKWKVVGKGKKEFFNGFIETLVK